MSANPATTANDPGALAAALALPTAFPDDPSAAAGVDWIQTHLSHVFLTGERVYKLRKAVDLGFVDFSTPEARNADCLREVELNRRLAPDVYLGVAPLLGRKGRPCVGPVSDALTPPAPGRMPLEHCVVMRRLPEGCDALHLLERGKLRPEHLDAVALRLAAFHREHGLGRPAPWSPTGWRAHVEKPVLDTLAALEPAAGPVVPRATWRRARDRTRAFLESHRSDFEARRREGHAVDGHGDVHLQHVWFEPGGSEPLLIDCLEFSDDLRRIDAASEVAFLAMDLLYRGRSALAQRFLRRYATEADDFGLYAVLDYYLAYRAAVRAKVAALAARDESIPDAQRQAARQSARRHLTLAARALEPRRRGALVLVAGVVGTGKSTTAELIAAGLGGAVVSSDRVRKHLAGLAPTDRGGGARGLYGAGPKRAVYEGLVARAAPVVRSGRVAVLDATWSRSADRARAWRLANDLDAPLAVVETRCERHDVLARLARRARRGADASDAGPERHARSLAEFEPLAPGEARIHWVVDTGTARWRRELRSRIPALREVLDASLCAPPAARPRGGKPWPSAASPTG